MRYSSKDRTGMAIDNHCINSNYNSKNKDYTSSQFQKDIDNIQNDDPYHQPKTENKAIKSEEYKSKSKSKSTTRIVSKVHLWEDILGIQNVDSNQEEKSVKPANNQIKDNNNNNMNYPINQNLNAFDSNSDPEPLFCNYQLVRSNTITPQPKPDIDNPIPSPREDILTSTTKNNDIEFDDITPHGINLNYLNLYKDDTIPKHQTPKHLVFTNNNTFGFSPLLPNTPSNHTPFIYHHPNEKELNDSFTSYYNDKEKLFEPNTISKTVEYSLPNNYDLHELHIKQNGKSDYLVNIEGLHYGDSWNKTKVYSVELDRFHNTKQIWNKCKTSNTNNIKSSSSSSKNALTTATVPITTHTVNSTEHPRKLKGKIELLKSKIISDVDDINVYLGATEHPHYKIWNQLPNSTITRGDSSIAIQTMANNNISSKEIKQKHNRDIQIINEQNNITIHNSKRYDNFHIQVNTTYSSANHTRVRDDHQYSETNLAHNEDWYNYYPMIRTMGLNNSPIENGVFDSVESKSCSIVDINYQDNTYTDNGVNKSQYSSGLNYTNNTRKGRDYPEQGWEEDWK